MSRATHTMSADLRAYVVARSVREPEILARLRKETNDQVEDPGMQVSPEAGNFLTLLTEMLGARRVIEVGTFTGYSALCMARGLPEDGQLIACDVNPETTAMARRYWDEAGVGHKIELRIAPALETLGALLADGQAGQFDLAFIDADKGNYLNYYQRCLELMRPGGVIAIDNVLWGGSVIDPENQNASTVAIRAFNEALHADERISVSLVPLGDGITLARKR